MQAAPNSHRALISVDHLSSPPSRLLLSFSLAPSNFFFPLLVGNILVSFSLHATRFRQALLCQTLSSSRNILNCSVIYLSRSPRNSQGFEESTPSNKITGSFPLTN
ncbi:hypothetical protein QL093DRAFT_1342372 [Fusarium oxysporum]|nr:hypothetical protein QL093DRAFT_1342372 [Fusarium oxysporum]